MFNENFRENKASVFEAIFDGTVHQFNMKLFTIAEEYLFDNITAPSETIYQQLRTYACEYWSQKHPMEQIEYIYEGTVKLRLVLDQ